MRGEEQNRSFYKETFEELPVPERLVEKVGKISEGTEKRKRTVAGGVMRKVAMAAAILVVLFAGSNGIAYAMTGETWLEAMMVRIDIEGEEYDVELREHQLRSGETIYIGDIETENDEEYRVQVFKPGQEVRTCFEMADAEMCFEEDRIYILDDGLELDITEDFRDDGRAKGTYEVNGILKGYSLWERDGKKCCWMEILYDGEKENVWLRDWLPEGLPTEKTRESEKQEPPTPISER
ncbi:MAG: hypothetical protein IJZ55_03985 [Lachnospiraceae bacterium]|nr:hypothetical protein [Lachnospiraceae bacterium]